MITSSGQKSNDENRIVASGGSGGNYDYKEIEHEGEILGAIDTLEYTLNMLDNTFSSLVSTLNPVLHESYPTVEEKDVNRKEEDRDSVILQEIRKFTWFAEGLNGRMQEIQKRAQLWN